MGHGTYPYAKDRAFNLQNQIDKHTVDYDNYYGNKPEDGKLIVQNLHYERLHALRCKINSVSS